MVRSAIYEKDCQKKLPKAVFSKVPVITGPEKLGIFTFNIELLIVLHLTEKRAPGP